MDNFSLCNDVFIVLTLLWTKISYALLLEQSPWTFRKIYIFSFTNIKPVEEGLASLGLAPNIIVEMQVVPISMPRINLRR
jgi:hypothetical protein